MIVSDTVTAKRQAVVAYVLLMLAPLFMASNVVIGRAASDTVPPVGLAFWRWLLAVLILLPFAWSGLRRHLPTLRREWRAVLALGAIGMGICGSFVYVGLEHTTATNAGLLYAVSPVLIVIIAAIWLGERVTALQAAGIALALLGVVVILTAGRPGAILTLDVNVGDLWVLGAVVGWAVYSVLLRRFPVAMPTIPLFAAIAGAGVICLAPFYAAETLAGAPVRFTVETLVSVAALALVASVLAFSSYQKGVAVIGPSRAGPFMYLMPVYGAVLAVIFLGEQFELFHAVGLALIVPGVAIASLRRRRHQEPGVPSPSRKV